MSFFGTWTVSDLKAQQADLASIGADTDLAVSSCTTLDAATRSGWQSFYATVVAFVAQNPVWLFATGPNDVLATGSRVDETQSLTKSVYAWRQQLSGKCSLSGPLVDPNPGDASNTGLAPSTAQTIEYVAVAAGFVASAVVVVKIASLFPSASQRARSRRETYSRRIAAAK
jgi:hypothetical protein